jgi:hypothetical protein
MILLYNDFISIFYVCKKIFGGDDLILKTHTINLKNTHTIFVCVFNFFFENYK